MPVGNPEVLELLSPLVGIESVTPWLVPGVSGELGVARYLESWLSDLPAEVATEEIEPGRANLLATLRGTSGGPRLCLNARSDTDRVREVESIFEAVRSEHPKLDAEIRVRVDREPFRAAGHEELFATVDSAARAVLGTSLAPAGLNAWADTALLQESCVPTLLVGPCGGNFGAPDEWVAIPEVAQLSNVLERAAGDYLA
ncbi:MAG TPA: M20/M25/M40 family metallo-hydrolase [Acidimicrobiales bacterium]|nr:M20/M25/M40 family metallo-hydrolase [Acidimicrobiales bacterium]